MNFACKEPLSAVFSLKKIFAIGEFIITLFWFTSVPSLLCFESFTVCKCGSPLTCFSMASFAAFSVPLIHLCEKFLISLILSSHFLQSEHWMQQTLDSVLISKSSFSYNSFSQFLSVFIMVVLWFEAIALIMRAVNLNLKNKGWFLKNISS